MVNHDVEGLCVAVESRGLQIGPFVANGLDAKVLSAVLLHTVFILGQGRTVVHVQRHKDYVLLQFGSHFSVGPNLFFHLPAVDAGPACEVQQHGLAFSLGCGQPFFVIVESRLHVPAVASGLTRAAPVVPFAVEGRRGEAADEVHGGAPHPWGQVNGQHHEDQPEREPEHPDALQFAVVRKGEPPEQVEGDGQTHRNPNGDEQLPLQQAKLKDEVGVAQEFEGKPNFQQTQHDFHAVQPTSALGQAVEPTWEGAEQPKGQS